MTAYDWDQTATRFAQEMGKYRLMVERGAVPFWYGDGNGAAQPALVAGVFGNDNCPQSAGNTRVEHGVEQVRNRLHDAQMQELGFGVSADGCTWALLFEPEQDRLYTAVGREFQKEMLAIFLEDIVAGA